MKFKVGDRVRVIKSIYPLSKSPNPNKQMYINKVFKIRAINPNGDTRYNETHYGIETDGNCPYIFLESELEPVDFTKSDLKDGMVVEYHCGDRRIVLGDKLMGFDSWVDIVAFNDNLECENNKDLNIYKVYNSDSYILKDYFKDKSLTLIWERNKEEPAKKMTVAEIEKELGYKVEIVSND